MNTIPTYALYGEDRDDPSADWVHCETIQSRSRLHNYVIQPHRHERLFQILHLTCGEASVTIDGRHTTLAAPGIVVVPAMVVHGYDFSQDVDGSVLTLFAQRLTPILASAPTIEDTFRSVQIVSLEGAPESAEAFAADVSRIVAEFAGRAAGRLAAIEARLALALIALHRIVGAARRPEAPANARALQHVLRFRQLVDHDFRSHKSLESYARRLGLTTTHLNRICRENLGETALGIVHQRMVLEAKRYLIFTTMSAKEIALALAFEDPSYFTRFFKRETGLSPTAFRALQEERPSSRRLLRHPGQP